MQLKNARRNHTGIYTLCVTSEAGEDKTDITVKGTFAHMKVGFKSISVCG